MLIYCSKVIANWINFFFGENLKENVENVENLIFLLKVQLEILAILTLF